MSRSALAALLLKAEALAECRRFSFAASLGKDFISSVWIVYIFGLDAEDRHC